MSSGARQSMQEFIAVAKALSDSNRARALMALGDGELCVCQIIELLGLAPSTVSTHMAVLRQAGLVVSRKEERWMYYRLPLEGERSEAVQGALRWMNDILKEDESVCDDQKALKTITRQNPSALCKMQRAK